MGASDKRIAVAARRIALLVVLIVALAPACDDVSGNKEPGAAATDRAKDFHSKPVDEALDGAADRVRTRGFTRDGEDWRGFVVQHETEIVELSLQSGTCYVVIGVGSSALKELDLRVFDSDGAEVAQDGQTGGRAAVQYCPPQSGTHYLGVRATVGNGLFAVRRFRGPTGLDVHADELFPKPSPPPAEAKTP